MKRLAIALLAIISLAMLFPGFTAHAQGVHAPHENPATAEQSPTIGSILSSYSSVFNLATTRDYGDAQRVLQEAAQGNIPGPLRDMVNQYRSLSQQLVTALNNTESLLDDVSTLASNGQTGEARQRLEDAGATIRDTQALLDDIQTATNALGDKLGSLAASPQISEAYQHQLTNLSQLRGLVNELSGLQDKLGLDPQSAIGTKFYFYRPTVVAISTPEIAYPGLPFTIVGQVSPDDGSTERTINLFLDDVELAKETVKGQFILQVTAPRGTLSGEHRLTLLANPQDRYLDASKSVIIHILRTPIHTDIKVPKLLITPKSIEISGKVSHDLSPVSDAQINIKFKDFSSTVKTAADGGFNSTLQVPFSLSLVGPEELGITVDPAEPWYTSLKTKDSIVIVNPAYAGLMLLLFAAAGVLLLKGVRTRPVRLREGAVITEAEYRAPAGIILPPRPKYHFGGISGKILSAYISGLAAIGKASGITMAPHLTLREFLRDVVSSLPRANKPFSELTTLAEDALYSAHTPDEDMAARSEQLVAIIKEELGRGTA